MPASDLKITALTAIGANPVNPATFPMPMVDTLDNSMAASGTTKKVTVNQILGAGGIATLASATITGALGAAGLNVTGATIPANGVYIASANNLSFAFNSTLGMSLNAGGLLVNNTSGFNTVANIKLKVGGRFLSGISGIGAYSFGTADAGGFVINDAGDGTTENRLLTLDTTGLGIGVSPQAKIHATTLNPTDGVVELLQNLSTSGQTGAKTKYEVANVGASGIGTPNGTTNALAFFVGGITSAEERARIDASGNLLVGTALSGGSISNTAKILAGIFSTLIGNTAFIATSTPTTIFAAPSESTLMVTAYITVTGAPLNYNVVAIVKVSGGTAAITTISTATNMTITLSGADVQVTQSSGVNQTVQFSVLRLA